MESPEIPAVVSTQDANVLSFSVKRWRYEIRPTKALRGMFRHAGFKEKSGLFVTNSPAIVRNIPEWELFADPDTYARVKTVSPT